MKPKRKSKDPMRRFERLKKRIKQLSYDELNQGNEKAAQAYARCAFFIKSAIALTRKERK